MNSYFKLIEDELGESSPKGQYEAIRRLKDDNISLYSKVRQAETLLTGLLKTPGLECLNSVLRSNFKTIVGREWVSELPEQCQDILESIGGCVFPKGSCKKCE